MSYFAFLRANLRWLAAGFMLMFASSFGQTFFISIFAGEIRATFGLSHGAWGGIYTIGTLASAGLMFLSGGLADRIPPKRLTLMVLILFICAALAMAANPVAMLLPVIIFALRYCGQGMMSHMAIVNVGRWFAARRGQAVSVTSLGFSVGEAFLPIIFVLIMGVIGWRGGWVVAALILVGLWPVLAVLLRADRQPVGTTGAEADQTGMDGRHWSRHDALSHWLFWICLPALMAPPAFGTAFFFQQVHLTEVKDWPLEGFVALFPIYTGSGVASMFLFGWIVDRFGSSRILPFFLAPLCLGLVLAARADTLLSVLPAFLFLGMMHGMNTALFGAFWPDVYGTKHLGSVRAVASSLGVFASAIGPGITGLMIDRGIGFETQLLMMAGYCLIVSLPLFTAMMRLRRHLVRAA
ncbi:MFS transporter [Oceanomicrobium pacificus]|uniref:MFS transporter n=1 Tax=Oceanomicrobium pacificus TaxID=2692916 RepID=A0A6B0TLG1_9RHOB|nr:MFS transporter [Oceanomicrobium pacificus]MXU64726.1 MFS transporter [Oceanomicrobium pacificus]